VPARLLGPVLGAGLIKYAEQKVSPGTRHPAHALSLPAGRSRGLCRRPVRFFVGEGWHLTLGFLFMVIVIFLPGGLMEGARRIMTLFDKSKSETAPTAANPQAAE
jgi:ABC-type branched-subunit amino acid transport system permease subunit